MHSAEVSHRIARPSAPRYPQALRRAALKLMRYAHIDQAPRSRSPLVQFTFCWAEAERAIVPGQDPVAAKEEAQVRALSPLPWRKTADTGGGGGVLLSALSNTGRGKVLEGEKLMWTHLEPPPPLPIISLKV